MDKEEAPEQRTGALVVMLPADSDPITAATSEDMAHMTTIWFGDMDEMPVDRTDLISTVRNYAEDLDGPIVVPVKERGLLGDDGADVVFLEPTDSLLAVRDGMLANEPIRQAHDAAEQFPTWTPHITLGYPEGVENGPAIDEYDGTEVTFDRLGLWLGGQYIEYPMGGTVTAAASFDMAGVIADADVIDENIEAEPVDEDDEDAPEEYEAIPVSGVAAMEGKPTGDGRTFSWEGLTAAPTPQPLGFEFESSHGGGNSRVAVVGRIDRFERHELGDDTAEMRWWGVVFPHKAYAGQALDGIVDGSYTGLSVIVDEVELDVEATEASFDPSGAKQQVTHFKKARIRRFDMVPTGAYYEGYIQLGHAFESDLTDEERAALTACGCADGALKTPVLRTITASGATMIVDLGELTPEELAAYDAMTPEEQDAYAHEHDLILSFANDGFISGPVKALVGGNGPEYIVPASSAVGRLLADAASGSAVRGGMKWGGDSFAPGTKDGPGWITNPVATSRIRRYWVEGEGAAKIKWGAPGDFNRCRTQLAKYVQNPEWLAGLCANMHREALGIWPAQHHGARAITAAAKVEDMAQPFTIVAAASVRREYPSEFFANPQFTEKTNLTIDRETGRVYGHLAYWDSCHIGIAGTCTTPPRSSSSYAAFLKGVVDTDAGEQRVGTLTYGIGHADPRMRASAATAHYDRPDAVRAYVNIGEDRFGIWYSGVIRPGVTDDQIDEFRAIGAISGDWRMVARRYELIAAVGVNTPGYSVSLVASGGVQEGLILEFEQNAITASGGETDENMRYLAQAAAMAVNIIENKKRATVARERARASRQADVRARMNKKG